MWLAECAVAACDAFDAKHAVLTRALAVACEAARNSVYGAAAASTNAEVHKQVSHYGRAMLADFTDDETAIAADDLAAMAAEDAAGAGFGAGGARGAPSSVVHLNPDEHNPFMLFLQTLLPWNHVAPAPAPAGGAAAAADGDADADGGGGGGGAGGGAGAGAGADD